MTPDSVVSALLLLKPKRIAVNLERVRRAGLVDSVPNQWQLALGVLRMWHRIIMRTETVGTCEGQAIRPTWRARLFANRAFRLPALVAERAVAPLDLTGLASDPDRMFRHLLGAHHDAKQFIYDLEILAAYPGKLEELRLAAKAVVDGSDRRASWLRDLVVFENYHENLLEAVERAVEGNLEIEDTEGAGDPDISFRAYLDWCARQPTNASATWQAWRRGDYSLEHGVAA
jgi:hypothetical protein